MRTALRTAAVGGCIALAAIAAADEPVRPERPPEARKVSAEELDRLILQLGDDDLAARARARKQLDAIGEPAVAALTNAAEASDDQVVRTAAQELLDRARAKARGEVPFLDEPDLAGRLGPARFFPLDLQRLANQSRTKDFHQDNLPGNNLAGPAAGEHRLHGIPFYVGAGVLQLGSQVVSDKPAQITGVQVGRAFTHLFVLHAAGYAGDEPDGVTVGRYTVRYAEGTARTIPIVNGQDVRGWWKRPGAAGPTRGAVAWEGSNGYVRRAGIGLRLFLSAWENPRPGVAVVGIDCASAMTQCAPFCVAITAAAPLRPRPPAGPVAAADLGRLWEQLGAEGGMADDAVESLAGMPGQAVPFLAERVRAARAAAVERRATALIARLSDGDVGVSDLVARELEGPGPEAAPYLRRSLSEPPTAEVRGRVERLLDRLAGVEGAPDQHRWMGALAALELSGTAEARGALAEIARGGAGDWLVSSAKAALKRLTAGPN